MGTSRNVYLGPYVECKQRPATKQEDRQGCSNERCANHARKNEFGSEMARGAKFCATCGTAFAKVSVTVKVYADPYDVVGDELSAHETDGGVIILVDNGGRKPPRVLHLDFDHAEDLSRVDPGSEVRWFERAYALEIAKLRDAFDGVTVKWGVHLWTS